MVVVPDLLGGPTTGFAVRFARRIRATNPFSGGDKARKEVRQDIARVEESDGPPALKAVFPFVAPAATRTEAAIEVATLPLGAGGSGIAIGKVAGKGTKAFGKLFKKAPKLSAEKTPVDDFVRTQGKGGITIPKGGARTNVGPPKVLHTTQVARGSALKTVGITAVATTAGVVALSRNSGDRGFPEDAGNAVAAPFEGRGEGLGAACQDLFEGAGGGLGAGFRDLFGGARLGAGEGTFAGLTGVGEGLKRAFVPLLLIGAGVLVYQVVKRD